ncbi:copper amine oxidase N-terminal domain-containing protein [Anaerotignum faecicola]
MKKLISMVMAAAMVVSLVPATAFADTGSAKAVAKVIDSADIAKNADEDAMKKETTQLQLKVDKDGQYTTTYAKHELTFTLDGAEFYGTDNDARKANIEKLFTASKIGETNKTTTLNFGANGNATVSDVDKDSFKLTIKTHLFDDNLIVMDLGGVSTIGKGTAIKLKSTSVGKKATIAVEGDMVTTDDLTFAEVKDTGIKATVKKVAEVAEEETTALERELKIEANVGNFVKGQRFDLKLSGSFEFSKLVAPTTNADYKVVTDPVKGEDKVTIQVLKDGLDTITIKADDMVIDANSAKAGAECNLTVKAVRASYEETGVTVPAGATKTDLVKDTFSDTADAVVIAKVVDNAVTLSVDEDDDVPVIYSGVNVANYGITDDSDHESLEVTIKESAAGALDVKKAIDLDLPDGVYVTAVDVTKADNAATELNGTAQTAVDEDDFAEAYKKGDEKGFEFARRTFVATDDRNINDKMELSFKLTLVAEPNFTGDVKLKLSGDGFDKAQEVTIAKFVSPYTVEAAQNDLIIDYRNTKVPTNVVVKEAEEGLWKKDQMDFNFNVDYMTFEDDATYTVDKDSDLEVKALKGTKMGFKVTEESSDKAAAVTISDVSLYMSRSIAAGAYDLDLMTTPGQKMLTEEKLATASTDGETKTGYYVADVIDMKYDKGWEDKFYTVKEGFINVITAGRDQDDASFTKKVVVPVGEKYLIAGEEQVALDVPAYISAQGYTMLPVRAVATALGINNNNVLWNQASRTVTILYGQRIITMVAGQKVVTVNGNTIPASATVQIKDGRTFLPMRDLATALGVTDITWDAATKTATMNGNQNK